MKTIRNTGFVRSLVRCKKVAVYFYQIHRSVVLQNLSKNILQRISNAFVFFPNSFKKYAPVPIEDKQTYGLRFNTCLGLALLYTIPTIISYPILMMLLKKITNPMKFKYLIGITIPLSVSLLLKLSTFGVDFTDYRINIELFMVAVFGAFIAKTMSKYVPT